MAVQLQKVRLECVDDARELGVIRIDRERNLAHLSAYELRQALRGRKIHMARRRSKEHKTNHVGAALERSVEGVRSPQSTDFN